MKILVAGATGAVGRQLVPLLVAAGHEVTGLSRTSAGAEWVRSQGASAVQMDVFDKGGLHEALKAVAPETVIHQLSDLMHADAAATDRLRVEGTRNLVDAAKAAGVNRIIAQSLSWGYVPGENPADETVPLDIGAAEPRGAMVQGVLALEETAAELDVSVSLRFGVLYGPRTWYARDGAIRAALAGDSSVPFIGYVEPDLSVTSFIHVADAARATVAALDWPGGAVNIVDDEPAEGREWVPILATALGRSAPEATTGRVSWARGASNKLARSRGWQPQYPTWRTKFADGLA